MAKNNNLVMANNKNNLWVVVGVALVIGLVAGIVGAGISGNVIRSANNPFGSYQVYTKQEVAKMIKCVVNSPYEGEVFEGETITIQGKQVSLKWMSSTQVKFLVDGEETNLLDTSTRYMLKDGTYISVKAVMYNAVVGSVGKVGFSLKPICVI